jgi:hypothetical protein
MPIVLTDDESGYLGIESECAKLNSRITEGVGADARRGCPVDTGELLGTIQVKHPEPLTGHVEVGTQYWDMLEYGGVLGAHTEGPYPPTVRKTDQHSHMDAQPFMRPALYIERAL